MLDKEPQHFQARLILARLQFSSGRIKEALDTLEVLATEFPCNLEVRYQYGMALQADGQPERAAAELEFVQTGREALQEARRMRELVMKANVNHIPMRYEIGKVLLQYESPEAGAGWLRSVLEYEPAHQGTHAALADYYRQIGNHRLAEAHRAQLIGGAPTDEVRPRG
jgi:predicted Zn-dependent protease